MAYVYNPNISEEENLRLAAEQDAGRPSSGVVAGGTQPAGAQPPGTPTASGSFTNIQRYLSENQPQAKALGERVAGQITQVGQEAKTAAEGVVQNANQQIEAGRVAPDQALIDEAAANPTGITGDAAKKSAFLKMRDAAYGGPQGLEDVEGFSTAQDKVRKAQENIDLAGSESGRTQLLTNLSPAGAGKGKLSLNQLLISGNQEASDIVAGAGEPYKNLGAYLTAESESARQKAVQAAQDTQAARRAVQDKFTAPGGALESFVSGLDQRVTSTRQGAADAWSAVAAKLDAGEPLSDQDLALISANPDQIASLYGGQSVLKSTYGNPLPASGFLQQSAQPDFITRDNLATGDDYARSQALMELMGEFPGLLSEANRGQAGTAVTDLGDLDVGRALSETSGRVKSLDNENGSRLRNLFYAVATGGQPTNISAEERRVLQDVIDRNTYRNPATGRAEFFETQFGEFGYGLNRDEMNVMEQKYGFRFDGPPPAPQPAEPPPPIMFRGGI